MNTPSEAPAANVMALDYAKFAAFDQACEKDHVKGAPQSPDEVVKRLRGLIDMLPQRDAIREEHAERWLVRTMETAEARMKLQHGEDGATLANIYDHVFWHIRRASGIGGSEASTVVKHFQGKRGTWGDLRSLVMEKLLILSPKPSTEEMDRGIRAEPIIQNMVHAMEGVKSDEAALNSLRNYRWDKRPGGVGTPDDILISATGGKGRELVDYKAPSAAVMKDYRENGVSEDYVAQLHHYAILAAARGIKIDTMTVRAHDPATWKVEKFDVPYDKELAKAIVNGINRTFTEFVMSGVLPEAPRPEDLPVNDPALINVGMQMASLKVLQDDLKKREDDLKKRVVAVAGDWHNIATGKLDMTIGAWSRDRVWDTDALLGLAEAADIDVSAFMKSTKKPEVDADKVLLIAQELHKKLLDGKPVDYILEEIRLDGLPMVQKLDAQALADALEADGISTVSCAKVKESFRLSTKKSGPEFERLSAVRGEMSELAEHLEQMIAERAENIILGIEEPAEDLSDAELGVDA